MADNPDISAAEQAEEQAAHIFNLNTRRGRVAARKFKRAAAARQRAANGDTREQHQADTEARKNANADKADVCQAMAKANSRRCRSKAVVTKEDPADGVTKRLCTYHASDEEKRKMLMDQARAVRVQRHAKPHELMRTVVESNPLVFMQPYLDALGIRVVFVPDPADPEVLHPTAIADPSSNGTTLFGVSKDGHVIVSKHKDIEAQQRAAERLFDRVYGKPKQTNIIAGENPDADLNIVPFDDKRQQEIAAILQAAKKPSHAADTANPANLANLTPEQLN